MANRTTLIPERPARPAKKSAGSTAPSASEKELTFDAFRRWGYLEATLDPLGLFEPVKQPDLDAFTGEAAEQARDYVRRINFVYTPKHGSWLNVAECELSCMTSQCLKDRRIGDIETLQTETGAWSTRVNEKQRVVDWQFTIEKARGKLKRLYPKI